MLPNDEAWRNAASDETPLSAAPWAARPGDPGFPESDPQIYSDAHYEPASETTTPPRYYTPPQRATRTRAQRRKEKRRIGVAAAVALCLICALLGGMLGAALNYGLTESRFTAMERALAENARVGAENAEAISAMDQDRQQLPALSPVTSVSGRMDPAQIYDLACSQVVGITTTVTTSNRFGRTGTGEISGSGFILSEDGYIITNYHVIEYALAGGSPITVVLHDGTQYEAQIVGVEDANDIAVLKIEASGLSPVTVGDSDKLRVGDEIYAVGNPLGELEFSMSTGHVSALDRVVSTEDAEAIHMFQLDAAVNPGNSGCPVYNTRGEVVGVVTAKYSETGVEGLGFAIPMNDAIRIAEDLVANGYVTGKAYMGVWLDERYNAVAAQYYGMPLGAYVSKVEPGSAADRAGIRSGDIITRIGDAPVESTKDLTMVLRQFGAGDETQVTLYRDGETVTVGIVFDEKTPNSGTVRDEG